MKIKTLEVAGFAPAFKGMRNALDSWHLSDSKVCKDMDCNKCPFDDEELEENSDCRKHDFIIGEKDLSLAQRLIKGGNEHAKFMRQIQVWADMNMPRYFWSEFDTYKFNTKNSCSTMHRLLNNIKPITLDLFTYCKEDVDLMNDAINELETLRQIYKSDKTKQKDKSRLLLRAKRLLPEGFLQLRTVNTNYAELRNIYLQRHNHRLKEEWQDVFCGWVETLPYAKELIIYEG